MDCGNPRSVFFLLLPRHEEEKVHVLNKKNEENLS